MNLKTIIFTLLVVIGAPLGLAQERATASGTIGSRDSVEIRVFREDDLTTRGQLSNAGSVSMPLIGNVRLSGMSTDSAARLIEGKLRDGYLVRPEVTVSITSRVRKTVTVLGKVQSPGVFRLDPNRQLTLAEAVGMAGGLQRIANSRKVTTEVPPALRCPLPYVTEQTPPRPAQPSRYWPLTALSTHTWMFSRIFGSPVRR